MTLYLIHYLINRQETKLAYKKPTGKKALQAELSQQKVRVQQARDELNRTVNGKFLDPNSAAYIAADLKFNNAVKRKQTKK